MLAGRGLRVLLVARRDLAPNEFQPDENPFSYLLNLTFVGLVGLMDPPRPRRRPLLLFAKKRGLWSR